MVSTWSRCEVGGEFIRVTRLGNKQLPHRIHLCILAHDSSGSLLPPRPSTPPGAIRELRCPSIWLSSIGFRVIGRRIEERGVEEGYWEAPKYSRLQSGEWGGATLGAGRHVSLHPPPIPLVYTANLIGVDLSMCIPLCKILSNWFGHITEILCAKSRIIRLS